MKRIHIVLSLSLIILLISCAPEKVKNSVPADMKVVKLNPDRPNLNINIFLDLSNRISPEAHPDNTMEYYVRDLGYINSITEAFVNHILNKQFISINDRIQVFLDPPPQNQEINKYLQSMKIQLTKDNATKEGIFNIIDLYNETADTIYKLAMKDGNYIGSDIWGFFKNKVSNYCIRDEYENILIILTDGYIYHVDNAINENSRYSYLTTVLINQLELNTSDWKEKIDRNDYGFISHETSLNNLKVLVLGVNAYRKDYEEDIIKYLIGNWFNEMGIEKYKLMSSDLPINMDEVIKEFIWNE